MPCRRKVNTDSINHFWRCNNTESQRANVPEMVFTAFLKPLWTEGKIAHDQYNDYPYSLGTHNINIYLTVSFLDIRL